jgi:hypothetical protein
VEGGHGIEIVLWKSSKNMNGAKAPVRRAMLPSLQLCLIVARWGDIYEQRAPGVGDLSRSPPVFDFVGIDTASSF